MSVHGGITVEDIPRGLSDEVVEQYFFSKGSEIQLFQFDKEKRKARIIFEDHGGTCLPALCIVGCTCNILCIVPPWS